MQENLETTPEPVEIEPKPEKGDLILVTYVNIGDLISSSKAAMIIRETGKGLEKIVPEARHIIIPVREGNTRIDCLNPRLAGPEEAAALRQKVEFLDKAMIEFLRTAEELLGEETKSTEKP